MPSPESHILHPDQHAAPHNGAGIDPCAHVSGHLRQGHGNFQLPAAPQAMAPESMTTHATRHLMPINTTGPAGVKPEDPLMRNGNSESNATGS